MNPPPYTYNINPPPRHRTTQVNIKMATAAAAVTAVVVAGPEGEVAAAVEGEEDTFIMGAARATMSGRAVWRALQKGEGEQDTFILLGVCGVGWGGGWGERPACVIIRGERGVEGVVLALIVWVVSLLVHYILYCMISCFILLCVCV
jgi:hypothetical protein